MFYVSREGRIFDDGYGMDSAPAYGVGEDGQRYELAPAYAAELTQSFAAQTGRRLPLGNAIARAAKAVGAKSCVPCAKRQAALNGFGERIAERVGRVGYWWE